MLVLDDDGGRYTAGVAEVLIDQGKQVLVATHFNALFPATFYTLDMPFLYQRLFEEGLSYRLNVWTSAIDDGSVSLFNIYPTPPMRTKSLNSPWKSTTRFSARWWKTRI